MCSWPLTGKLSSCECHRIPHWWYINIGTGNGLVPSGNKPLSEPMMTQISPGHNELSFSHGVNTNWDKLHKISKDFWSNNNMQNNRIIQNTQQKRNCPWCWGIQMQIVYSIAECCFCFKHKCSLELMKTVLNSLTAGDTYIKGWLKNFITSNYMNVFVFQMYRQVSNIRRTKS